MSISSKKILPATIQPEKAKFFSYITDNSPFLDYGYNYFFSDMCLDSEGNIYIVGGQRSDYPMKFANDDVCHATTFFAMKLNSSYEVQWQKERGNLPAARCCLIGSSGGNEYLVIGHVGSFGNCSVSTMDMSTGAAVDQKRYDQSTGLMHSVQKIIPDPSIDGRFHTVGSLYKSAGGREMACGGLITMTSAGILSAGGTFRIQYWSSRSDNSTWYDVLYDHINDYYIAVGHYDYANNSNDLATVGSSTYGTEFLNAKIITRDERDINSFISSINMDSSGYKYTTHTDGYIQKVNWNSSSTYATTTAEWRVKPTSLYDYKSSCAKLSSDENYLYVGTRKGALLKIATSDGSLVGKMAWPSAGSANTDNNDDNILDNYGIQKIYVQNGKIYILLNVKSTMSSKAGNLIVMSESSFGTDMRLGNGNGFLNADQADLYTAAGLNSVELATLTYENTTITTTTFAYALIDITNNTFTEIPNSTEGPIVIYGNYRNRIGSTSTASEDVIITEQGLASRATFTPKEGDIVVYVGSLGTSAAGITLSYLSTPTAGYTDIINEYSSDTVACEMRVQWKRMGATPDTSIKFPYNNGNVNNSSILQAIVLRDFNSDATPYAENNFFRKSNSYTTPPPSLTLANDSIVLVFHTNGQQVGSYGYSISDNSYNVYVNANLGMSSNDTYDTSLIIGNTDLLSAGTAFAPTGKPVYTGADSVSYSSLAFSIAFPIG
jgi:hypothetical protein